jgi:RimJ/RimL family protein N-acetyltransferase
MTMSIHVHELNQLHVAHIKRHFNSLGDEDLRLRFGGPVGTEQIENYVNGIDFEHDAVFGVYADDLTLIGVAHLPRSDDKAELGLSVLARFRTSGVGTALFKRAVMHARNEQVGQLFMHCLTQNDAIMHIARKQGMRVVHEYSEADAYLELRPGNPITLGEEMLDRNLALFDLSCKTCFVFPRQVLENAIP